jgi:hypothetical protein
VISYNIHILVTAGNKKTSMFLPFPTPIGLLGKDEIMKVHVPAVPPYFLQEYLQALHCPVHAGKAR